MPLIWVLSIFLMLFASAVIPASAQATSQMNGYRNCSPRNLAVCDDSDELFWGPSDKSGRSVRKREFTQALNQFLQGAPKIYTGGYGFTPAQVAQESLVGPGDRHNRLPSGEWFFDGFTPHDAPDKGAVLFDDSGKIIAVALLDTETDAANLSQKHFGQYRLRIYSNSVVPRFDLVKSLRDWAHTVIDPKSLYAGVFPGNALVASELVVSQKNGWEVRPLR